MSSPLRKKKKLFFFILIVQSDKKCYMYLAVRTGTIKLMTILQQLQSAPLVGNSCCGQRYPSFPMNAATYPVLAQSFWHVNMKCMMPLGWQTAQLNSASQVTLTSSPKSSREQQYVQLGEAPKKSQTMTEFTKQN